MLYIFKPFYILHIAYVDYNTIQISFKMFIELILNVIIFLKTFFANLEKKSDSKHFKIILKTKKNNSLISWEFILDNPNFQIPSKKTALKSVSSSEKCFELYDSFNMIKFKDICFPK